MKKRRVRKKLSKLKSTKKHNLGKVYGQKLAKAIFGKGKNK